MVKYNLYVEKPQTSSSFRGGGGGGGCFFFCFVIPSKRKAEGPIFQDEVSSA
jgi:hypothetical protein